MTFQTCERLILTRKEHLNGGEWTAFVEDMTNKLDIFLLNSRITDEQYSTLIKILG